MNERSSKNIDTVIQFFRVVITLLILAIVGCIIYGVMDPSDQDPGWQFRIAIGLCPLLVGSVIGLALNIKARKS